MAAPMRKMLQRRSIAGRVALGCAVAVGIGGIGVAFFVAGRTPHFGPAFANVALLVLTVALAVLATCRYLLARELATLAQIAAAIDSAELDGSPLYRNLPDRGPAEIERIVAAWNGFALRFDILMHGMRDRTTALNRSAQRFDIACPEAAQRAREATAALAEITRQVRVTAAGHDAMLRLVQAAADGADTARQQLDGARPQLQQLAGTMHEVAAANERTRAVLRDLHELARQTRMSGLNGSIEAARAGEHGRAFAAITNELRALAERASALVRGHTQDVGAALRACARGNELLHALQQALDLTGAGLQQLRQHAGELQQQTAHEAEAAGAVCARGDEMLASASTVAARAAELAGAAAEVSAAAADVEAAVWPPPEVDDRDIVAVGQGEPPGERAG